MRTGNCSRAKPRPLPTCSAKKALPAASPPRIWNTCLPRSNRGAPEARQKVAHGVSRGLTVRERFKPRMGRVLAHGHHGGRSTPLSPPPGLNASANPNPRLTPWAIIVRCSAAGSRRGDEAQFNFGLAIADGGFSVRDSSRRRLRVGNVKYLDSGCHKIRQENAKLSSTTSGFSYIASSMSYFASGKNYFNSGKNYFARGLSYFARGLNYFDPSKNYFDSGLSCFDPGKNYFDPDLSYFASGKYYFARGLNYSARGLNYFYRDENDSDSGQNHWHGLENQPFT